MTEQSLLERFRALPANLVDVVRAEGVSEALEAGLSALMAFSGAERAFAVMESDGRPTVMAAAGLDRSQVASAGFHRSRRIIDYIFESGVAFTTGDLGADQRFGDLSDESEKGRAVWALPLRAEGETLGAVYLDAPTAVNALAVETLPASLHIASILAVAVHGQRTSRRLRLNRDELRIENRALERMANTLQEDVAAKSIEISQFERDLESKNRALDSRFSFANIVGQSECMRRLFDVLHQVMDYEPGFNVGDD